MSEMKALVKLGPGPGNMKIVRRPMPECESGEVLVRVTAASICGSDLHIYLGELECKSGVILGHEFAGEIVSTADDVREWRLGDKVTSELHVGACGQCHYCRRGMIMMCPSKRPLGWSSDGAFAEYVKVPASLLHRIPDSVSDRMAALTEPLACALAAINVLGIHPGDFAAVVGAGFMGLASAKIVKALGVGKVAIVGRSRKSTLRLETARQMGFDLILDSDRDDVVSRIKTATNGLGANIVIEAAGSESALRLAVHAVRPSGAICAIGLTAKPTVTVEWDEMMRRRIRVFFAWSADSQAFERVLSLLADRSVSFPEGMLRSFPIEKWRDAFEALETRKAVKAQFVMA